MAEHDCDGAGCTGIVRRTHLERLAQGLPLGIVDTDRLRMTALILNNPAGDGASAAPVAAPRKKAAS